MNIILGLGLGFKARRLIPSWTGLKKNFKNCKTGITEFEWKYGANQQRDHIELNDEGVMTHTYTPGAELVEGDRKRVTAALGRTIDPILPRSSFERSFLENKKFVLIDLSGTIHVEDEPTDRAIQALMKLRIHGYSVLFVTNTSKESKAKLHSRLIQMQFDIKPDEIFTSLIATRKHVVENALRPMLLVADEALEEFEGVDQNDPNCVVVGLSKDHFNLETLSIATRLILAKEAKIVAVHKGTKYRSASGMNMGPGCFVVALEMASGQVATTLGKPEVDFYLSALKHIGCDDPSLAVMIGDDVFDDVYGAMHAGISGILVKTGKYMKGDENKILPHEPDVVVDNFYEAVQRLIDEKKYLSRK